jgi:hypothetical protein
MTKDQEPRTKDHQPKMIACNSSCPATISESSRTENWRGRPLVDRETVVQLIGSVRTTTGLKVKAKIDLRQYPTGIKVSDADMDALLITQESFHGEWNYTIHPRVAPQS